MNSWPDNLHHLCYICTVPLAFMSTVPRMCGKCSDVISLKIKFSYGHNRIKKVI